MLKNNSYQNMTETRKPGFMPDIRIIMKGQKWWIKKV